MGRSTRHLPTCPGCHDGNQLSTGHQAFHCTKCGLRWRRALCEHCGEIGSIAERSPSWRCSACRLYTRSYWKTPSQADEVAAAAAVSERIADDRRRGRRRLVSVIVVAASLVAVFTQSAVVEDRSQRSGATAASVCVGFERVMREEASGSLPPGRLTPRLAELDRAAGHTTERLHRVTSRLVAASHRGSADPEFQSAATELASRCDTGAGSALHNRAS